MSNKSPNSKRTKNELNSILAQLKQSYASDTDDVAVDVDDANQSLEEDNELSSILKKLFLDNTSDSDIENNNNINYGESENLIGSEEALEEEIINESSNTSHPSKPEDTTDIAPFDTEQEEEGTDLQNSTEVDDVLQLMFSHKQDASSESDQARTEESTEHDDEQVLSVIVDESIELSSDTSELVENSDNYDGQADILEMSLDELNSMDLEEDTNYIDTEADTNFAVEDEEYDTLPIDDANIDELNYEELDDSEDDTDIDYLNNPDDIEEIIETQDVSRLVLSPEEYTYDPLQNTLPVLENMSMEYTEVTSSQIDKEAAEQNGENTANESRDLNNTDISLLLKFGYNEEVASKIGEENIHKVLTESDAEFKPEFYNTPYGYCGKELSERHQIKGINAKYKSDKLMLLIKLISVFVISLAIFAENIYFIFFADRSAFPLFVVFELLGIAVLGALIWKDLVFGAVAIVKFEGNLYSTLVLTFSSYLLYDIAVLILYAINYESLNVNDLMMFGPAVALYALFTAAAELLNCTRESNTFSIISSAKEFYTAENHIEDSVGGISTSAKGTNAYKIRRTAMINGYFQKISRSTEEGMSLIYIIGIIPIMALIIGCSGAIISKNVFIGLSSMMITALLCTPIACVFIPSLIEFVLSIKLKRRNTAFVGSISSSDYTKTSALYFTDTDAIDIISCIEIQPGKAQSANESLAIAHSVFRSLGGPLGKATNAFRAKDDPDARKEIVINSISDNGIDLYFDSSLNILIGDKQYMQSHNIKVKTDTSLHTATKGLDRSVIYMAFDGIPKLGFIITSRIKSEFASTVSLLTKNNIRVYVDSYEPQINDIYFEQNKVDGSSHITICKSGEYDYVNFRTVCNGNIICTEGSTTVARSILESKNVVEIKNRTQRTNIMLSVAGLIASLGISALLCLGNLFDALGSINLYVPIIFNTLIICGIIPGAISIFKIWKKDSLLSDNQGNTK